MNSNIKVIILDYAGVITPTKGFSKFIEENHDKFNLSPGELHDLLRKDWNKTKVNQISSKQYWKNAARALGTDEAILRRNVLKTFPIDKRIIRLLAKLKPHYTAVLLSNQIEDWLEEVISINDLNNYFDYFITSYNTGFSKPDKRIFEIVVRKTKSSYPECLFIDDQSDNVKSAADLGMHAILYVDYHNLIKELKSLRIKI